VRLRSLTLDELRIDDERSYRHIGLYEELKRVLVRDRVEFLVPAPGARRATWDRVLFLNLTFWSPDEAGDLLETDVIPADVMMHAAWHHLTRKALAATGGGKPSPEALFLGEAIASAFDLYLVGRLLGHAPDAVFLETQVPAMAEAAEAAGMPEEAFEALLEDIAKDPDRSFEDLRQLLFDASVALQRCHSLREGAETIARFDDHRFGALLHHYELSTWVLYARAYGAQDEARDAAVMAIDAELRRADVALDWLEKNWLIHSGGPAAEESRERSG
jgi:hypothetical protein